MNCINKLRILITIVIFPIAACAQNQERKSVMLPLDPAVRYGKLANGFTYYIRHNEEPKNRVVMYMVNKVGSVLEDDDQRGLAHFMEHMSFNGTKHFPKNDLVDYLQKSGIRFGADLNAYTSFDETVYELPLPTDKPDILNKGILIMHDWAQSATLDPIEVDKERGVVLEEKRLGKGAGERMQRQTWPLLLNNSRYAVRIPIGVDTVLNNFKQPVIKRFYEDWYRPDLQALIVVGDIDVNEMERIIKSQFADLKNPLKERYRVKYTASLIGKNQFLSVTDKEMAATEVEVLIKHPAPDLKTTQDYRNAIIQRLFNQMLAERYSELLRQSNPPFIQGQAGISGFIANLDSYNINVVAKPGELENGFKAVWRETERMKRFGFTFTELERAKQNYLNGIETALKEKEKTNSSSYIREYQEHFLKGIAAPGIAMEYQLTKNVLPGIMLADVKGVAKKYLTTVNRDILIEAPEKDKNTLPDEAMVNNWIKDVEQENLQPYVDEVSTQPFLTKEPQPGKISNEQKDTKLGVIRLTLSNGVKVILKPTDFKNDEVLFSAFAPGGTSLASDVNYQSAENAADLIAASGVGNYSATEKEKFLSGKQLGVQPFINERFSGVYGGSTTNDLETALMLVYAYMTEPRKDQQLFDGIIARSKAKLINRTNDPKKVFGDTVNAILSNYNFRRTGPTLEKLNQVNLDKAYDFYKSCFMDASNFTFVLTGSFDPEKIKPLLEKYVGGLPSTGNSLKAKDLDIHIPIGKIEKSVFKGSEPQAAVILVYSGLFDYNHVNCIQLDALKETLEIRLLQRLREDEGGVYSPGVMVSTEKYPQARYNLVIQFGCAPQNVEKLIASTKDEINKLRTDGPSQENVEKWRAEDKNKMETQLKTNGFWQSYLTSQVQNNEPLEQIIDYPLFKDKITKRDLKNMASKYLDGNNYIRLVLLPENTKKSK